MTKRVVWTLVFLPLTAIPIGLECWAGFSHDPNLIPWTQYISHYIPWWVSITIYAVLVVWLPIHFWHYYHLRGTNAQLRENLQAQANAIAAHRSLPRDVVTLLDAADRAEAALRGHFAHVPATRRPLLGEVIGDARKAILRVEDD